GGANNVSDTTTAASWCSASPQKKSCARSLLGRSVWYGVRTVEKPSRRKLCFHARGSESQTPSGMKNMLARTQAPPPPSGGAPNPPRCLRPRTLHRRRRRRYPPPP
ncbi:unnamed protein product, partial [Ectocarpus sp. 13 AM-2016]